MMKNLLAPYEQRPWAQTNWILVRLWRVSILHPCPSLRLGQVGRWAFHFPVAAKPNCFPASKIFPYFFYQGCGFGYRYTRLPHLLKTKPEDASLPSLQSESGRRWALGITTGGEGGLASSLAAIPTMGQASWWDGCLKKGDPGQISRPVLYSQHFLSWTPPASLHWLVSLLCAG